MKRKVIQIAESTQLISLPRKWAIRYNIKKGDELEVEEKANQLVVSTEKGMEVEHVELDATPLKDMVPRVIHSLYKRGVDEIRVTFKTPEELSTIQRALGKETVGFEIVEQGATSCLIKNVSGDLEEFDQVLRRTFLLLITMVEEGFRALKEKDNAAFKNVALLEESNNRFTTTCRRFLNKRGYQKFSKVGPIYYMIEDIENLADQYKYMYQYLEEANLKKSKVSPKTIEMFDDTNKMLKLFYEVYYKYDSKKIAELRMLRKKVVKEWYGIVESSKSPLDLVISHHLSIAAQKIFNYVGPYLVHAL